MSYDLQTNEKKLYIVIENDTNKVKEIIEMKEEPFAKSVVKKFFENCYVIEHKKEHGFLEKNWIYGFEKFFPPKPYESWILTKNGWSAPKQYINNDKKLINWNEDIKDWEEITEYQNVVLEILESKV